MAKYYMMEELAGAEHEAGPPEFIRTGSIRGDGTTGDASGTKLRPHGPETKNGCHKKKALKKTRGTLWPSRLTT